MKIPHIMEYALITIPAILCTLLLLKLLCNLRSTLPWRVNCWFCNRNFWVKFTDRNCWTCPKCEQYNGFTKDGDYNKVLSTSSEYVSKSPKLFQRSPPKNGLCKMCNINQQLKVTQLANFVPMNESRYDDEIDMYRTQLEKAYKLCSSCKKVLQMKLHKEKETLLGTKLLEKRMVEKSDIKRSKQNELIKNIINTTSRLIAGILVVLVAIECYENASKHRNLSNTVYNIKVIFYSFIERIISIVKMKTLLTFPSLEKQFTDINNAIDIDIFTSFNSGLNDLTQKSLGSFVCFIQIIGHFWNINQTKYSIIIDLLWSIFVVTSIGHVYITTDPIIMSLIKLSSTLAVLLVYSNLNNKTVKMITRKNITPKKLKNLANGSPKKFIDEEDNISLDTDDDVSLCKFGLNNFTESSNETTSPLNNSLINGRSFTPRSDSTWSKPKLNSTFSVNSVMSNSPNPLSDSVFIKPSFNKYQKNMKDDSDSDLDESISSLCISSPKKKSSKMNPVFALRKFNASPNFVAPTPLNRARPLISPSKLGHGTSWVAGGYWGTEGERQIFNVNGSRSSSQSSGFESQASSMNQRNLFSHPPSREESICGEPEKSTLLLDRFQNCNMNHFNSHQPPSFTPISTPVFPQLQYNSHVQIPQPRFAQQTFVSQNVFTQQHYVPNSMFKAPGGSRLIKLPQDNSFTSR
ncbi:transmembrane protein 201 [Vanessa atalanta]|uniref:transmembrane protein 201 n=1 Tax=Vanessa atalanta TaxID=42275 RepID=UPI001FCD6BC9|nr:transmembrane protein 201 [Vanessa atalanta]